MTVLVQSVNLLCLRVHGEIQTTSGTYANASVRLASHFTFFSGWGWRPRSRSALPISTDTRNEWISAK